MLLTEPIVTLFDLYVAFNFGLLNAFFAAFAWVFETVYGFDVESTGLTYLAQAAGSLVGLGVLLCTYRFYWTKHARLAEMHEANGKMSPDKRLVVAMAGALILPIS